jgi:modification methylase
MTVAEHRAYDAQHRADTGPDTSAEGLSVWATAQSTGPVQRKGRYVPESIKHPARMLPAIAEHAVEHYARPGDLVLDPMCGIGTALVVAVNAGRDAIGVEYESKWSDIADANIKHAHSQGATGRGAVIRGDATTILSLLPAALAGQVALVVTSPPYGPTVHGLVRPGTGGVAKTATSPASPTGSLRSSPGAPPCCNPVGLSWSPPGRGAGTVNSSTCRRRSSTPASGPG